MSTIPETTVGVRHAVPIDRHTLMDQIAQALYKFQGQFMFGELAPDVERVVQWDGLEVLWSKDLPADEWEFVETFADGDLFDRLRKWRPQRMMIEFKDIYFFILRQMVLRLMEVRNYVDGAKSVPHQIILTLHDDQVLQFEIIRQVYRKKTA